MATRRVRTGETSYLNLNDADYKTWKAAGNVEYGTAEAPADEPEAKAESAPAEDKARRAPDQKKSRG